MLNEAEKAIPYYKRVLTLDASNVEAIACLGAHYFYSDQAEMSLRYYRRLLQMGISNNTELWNNIGLCCFYSSQYDMALTCIDRALRLATDDELADVWYNIGHIGIALGDLGLAYQAFKVAISVDPSHGEALNNISVLEIRRQKIDTAKAGFSSAITSCPHLFEPMYNAGLMSYRTGDFQDAFINVNKSLQIYPTHGDSKELQDVLQKMFMCA
jgi:tetratricopeptide repeat protein 8